MWRKAQHSGIAPLYATDEKIRTQFHSVLGLPFVPEDHIINDFSELTENSRTEMGDIFDLIGDYLVLGPHAGMGVPDSPSSNLNLEHRGRNHPRRTKNKQLGGGLESALEYTGR